MRWRGESGGGEDIEAWVAFGGLGHWPVGVVGGRWIQPPAPINPPLSTPKSMTGSEGQKAFSFSHLPFLFSGHLMDTTCRFEPDICRYRSRMTLTLPLKRSNNYKGVCVKTTQGPNYTKWPLANISAMVPDGNESVPPFILIHSVNIDNMWTTTTSINFVRNIRKYNTTTEKKKS